MKAYISVLACLVFSIAHAQKIPSKVGNSAANKKPENTREKLQRCDFPAGQGLLTAKSIWYNKTRYSCIECPIIGGSVRTLVPLGSMKSLDKGTWCVPAGSTCNGMWCGFFNWTCLLAHNLQDINPPCVNSRAVQTTKRLQENNPVSTSSVSQIPLIIGFTVGGILLAIVVAGIFLGRNQRTEVDTSENMTTPVSLSNSEWLSNGGGSGISRPMENLRVQEASTEDISSIPLYDIYSNGKNGHVDANANGIHYLLKSNADDTSSMGQYSYYGGDPDLMFAMAGHPSSRSSRSDDVVMLDDGYVPGGNFIGADLKESKTYFNDKNHNNTQMHWDAFTGRQNDENQDFFWTGTDHPVPGSMTHDSITLSLTHAPNFDGIEYTIEDQDLVGFDQPVSYSKQRNKPTPSHLKSLDESEETMRISVQYRGGDSDFDETDSARSIPNSAAKSDKSDVFAYSDTPCKVNVTTDGGPANTSSGLQVESPCSESGIEVSCNSKDSCEIRVVSSMKTNNSTNEIRNVEISCHARSWNENCKGKASVEFERKRSRPPQTKRFFGNEKRSRSCTWKSPAAPTHSSSRKYSAPIPCPSSAPAHARPHTANLTHVFVDVHRNMLSSDEDLLAFNPSPDVFRTPADRRTEKTRSSFSSSDGGSTGDLKAPSALPKSEPATFSNSSMPRSYKSPANNNLAAPQRNRSMYTPTPRYGRFTRTPESKPRTVRFSSSGSGEYAIPFGSFVP